MRVASPPADSGLIPGVPVVSFAEFSGAFHARAAAARVPVGAMFELTYRCNFDCVHCYVVQPHTRGELATDEVLRILGELRAAGTLFLTFTGGEALTRPDFAAIWREAKRLGFVLSLFSNGALLKERALELLCAQPPHKVEVTLYGASEASYAAVTRRRGMHARVLAAVDRLQAAGIRVHLKAVGLRETADELPALLEEARARGVEAFFKHDNHITGRLDCRRGPAEHRLAAEQVVAQDREDPRRIGEFRRLYLKTRGRRLLSQRLFRCGAGTSQVVIDPYGNMQLCALYRRESWSLRSQGGVAAGWRHLTRVVEQPITRPTRCRSCDKQALCGACPGNNLLENGDPEEPPDFLCAIAYARLEAFCADLRPQVPQPAGRWLPLHRRRTCSRPWLATPEPVGRLLRARPPATPSPGARSLPVVS